MVPNSTDYGGICQMWEDGSAVAFVPQVPMVIRSIPVASSSMRQADTDSESWAMSTFITTPSSVLRLLAADTFLNSTQPSHRLV